MKLTYKTVFLPYSLDDALSTVGGKGAKNAERLYAMFAQEAKVTTGVSRSYQLLERPTVFIDNGGLVIAWYIPEAIGIRRCVSLYTSIMVIFR